MKITVNNLKVPDEVEYNECKIMNSTLIFKPSEVGKYSGSVIKHIGTGIGSPIKDDYVNVIKVETDLKNIKWCLIKHNGCYYYTPADRIDLRNFKDPNPEPVSLDEKKDEPQIVSYSSNNTSRAVKASDASTAPYVPNYIVKKIFPNLNFEGQGQIIVKLPNGKYIYERVSLFNNWSDSAIGYINDSQYDTILSGLAYNAYPVYEYPTYNANPIPAQTVINCLKKSRVFPIQSVWRDNTSNTNSLYYGTTFFNESSNSFKTVYIRECHCTMYNQASMKYNQYYSMCHSANSIAGIQLANGENPGNFTHHDMMTAHFPVDGVGYGCDLYQITRFNNSGTYCMIAIKPAAYNEFSPNAHSKDFLDKNYLGCIQNKNSTTKCRRIDIGKFFGQLPKNTHRFKASDITYWLSTSSSNPTQTLASTAFKPLNENLKHVGPKLITYNKVTYNKKSYYIAAQSGDRDAWYFIEDDDTLNWVALPNGYSEASVPDIVTSPSQYENITYDGISYEDITGNVSNLTKTEESISTGNPQTKTEADDSKKDANRIEPWYDVKLNGGDKTWKVPGILEGVDEAFEKSEGWGEGLYKLASAEIYEGGQHWPTSAVNNQQQLNRINRFRLLPTDSGLSTRSFIFMTRPDLNLFDRDANGNIIDGHMNPDLKRLPTFKYIARLRRIGGIMSMLESSSSNWVGSNNRTPWLSIITNQATGYSPTPREMDTVEVGETFHGNKIIYAEPTFNYKIAGTIDIPFRERRDLSLYYTLKMWIDYIQAVTLGRASPKREYIQDMILDYATSIYFIQTDETMENILYWEKLVGVIPLTVPDNFFEWDEKTLAKNMEYTIKFAYSMRVVQDEMSLFEINNLYTFADRRDGGLAYFDSYNLSHNPEYDELIATVADSLGTFNNDTTGYAYKFNNNEFMQNTIKDAGLMKRFYYANKSQFRTPGASSGDYNGYDIQVAAKDGSTSFQRFQFLPNWIPDLGMHGTPYVTGPFITKELDRLDSSAYLTSQVTGTPQDNGMYKLRWV